MFSSKSTATAEKMYYTFDKEAVDGGFRFTGKRNKEKLPYMMALDLLERRDAGFTQAFLATLKDSVKYRAYFFETPPVTGLKAYKDDFEFVLLKSEDLERIKPDVRAFSEHFSPDCSVVSFKNLGGDAALVVPCPLQTPAPSPTSTQCPASSPSPTSNPGSTSDQNPAATATAPYPGTPGPTGEDPSAQNVHLRSYSHLAAFVRGAPKDQVEEFWYVAGKTMKDRLLSQDRPVWMSTCGLGVSWLHLRMDSYPKYYSYQPYKIWASSI